MILINSGAYVVPEFQAELGRIPPCLLPINHSTLLTHQVTTLRQAFPQEQDIVVSLPQHYQLSLNEQRLLDSLGVHVISMAEDLSLGEAILQVLAGHGYSGRMDGLRMLHGDTLMEQLPASLDVISVSSTQDDYAWELETQREGQELVWCGYFAFSSISLLCQSLSDAQQDFVTAVRTYATRQDIRLEITSAWHDFGHINTYYRSRSVITTQRACNNFSIHNRVITKEGQPGKKLQAEAAWLMQLPARLQIYTPKVIEHGPSEQGAYFYRLEYLPMLPLSEVFVHGRNPVFFWDRMFSLAKEFLSLSSEQQLTDEQREAIATDFDDLCLTKTEARLMQFAANSGLDLHAGLRYDGHLLPSALEICRICAASLRHLPAHPGIMHGDFCLSNILLDSRNDAIKLIDPRGLDAHEQATLLGDCKYDLAKLAHSTLGLYDFIIAGRYTLHGSAQAGYKLEFDLDRRLQQVQARFMQCEFLPGVTVQDIMPLTVLLFLSMLPLHHDRPDRQQAMLANALRLFLAHGGGAAGEAT